MKHHHGSPHAILSKEDPRPTIHQFQITYLTEHSILYITILVLANGSFSAAAVPADPEN